MASRFGETHAPTTCEKPASVGTSVKPSGPSEMWRIPPGDYEVVDMRMLAARSQYMLGRLLSQNTDTAVSGKA